MSGDNLEQWITMKFRVKLRKSVNETLVLLRMVFSGMLRCVALAITDVSEEASASFVLRNVVSYKSHTA
jgi:hypothetical protein